MELAAGREGGDGAGQRRGERIRERGYCLSIKLGRNGFRRNVHMMVRFLGKDPIFP